MLLEPEEAAAMDAPGKTDAAVLVPLFERDGDLTAVFTERRHDLRRHAGEISFPGGRQDEPDEDLRETALREAEEEIGLARAGGAAGSAAAGGNLRDRLRVFPFVGWIQDGNEWMPQETEVEQVLELSLPGAGARLRVKRLSARGCRSRPPRTPSTDTSSGERPGGWSRRCSTWWRP